MKRLGLLIFVLLPCCPVLAQQGGGISLNPSLASTPPMGWNAWPMFYGTASDAVVRGIAAAMVSDGFVTAGYQYVGLDDGWDLATRDTHGNLQANPSLFPYGVAALATYVHSEGLKFGIYLSAGTMSCEGFMGTYGHEGQDAALLASWGVDLLKLDPSCNMVGTESAAIQRMAKAIQATGRAIVLTSGDGAQTSAMFAYAVGSQSTRIGTDMANVNISWGGLLNAFTNNLGIAQLGGPNHWLDQDCVLTGESYSSTTISDVQGQTAMNVWSIQAAPLIFGADIRSGSSPDAATIATLTNEQVIAVDQDALGIAGTEVSSTTCGSATCQVWVKPLNATNTCAIAMFNLDTAAAHNITATFSTIAAAYPQCGSGPYTTTSNLWANWPSCGGSTSCAASLSTLTGSYTASSVPAYGSVMIKVAP